MLPPAPAADPAPRRSTDWRTLALVLGAVLLAALGVAALWYTSDADLRAVAAEARARGHATTWEEFGRVPSPSRDLIGNDRLRVLARALRLYSSGEPYSIWRDEPLPEALVAAHQGLDPAALAEALAIESLLPSRPVVGTMATMVPPFEETQGALFLTSLLIQRFQVEPLADPLAEAQRLLLATDRLPSATSNELFIRVFLLSRVLRAIVLRIAQFGPDRAGLAEAIRARRDRLIDDLRLAAKGDLVWKLASLRDVEAGMRALGLPRPNRWQAGMVRFGRGDELRRHLAWLEHVSMPSTLHALFDAKQRIFPEPDALAWSQQMATHLLRSMDRPSSIDTCLRADLLAGLVIAELTDGAWPADPFAPGRRLRAVRRDGVLIGAYSLGPDGVDGTALNRDWAFPLYAPITMKMPHDTEPGRGGPAAQ